MYALFRHSTVLFVVIALFAGTGSTVRADHGSPDPELSVDAATLDSALWCRGAPGEQVAPEDPAYLDPLMAGDREPILLVHGTGTNGEENYRWALAEALGKDGYSPCWVTYPNRGLDDMQVSAEYVVKAIHRLAALTDRQVDVLGHSQGAILPRWAVRFWPHTARANVDDLVLLAGPHHGTTIVEGYGLFEAFGERGGCQPQLCTGAMWQFDPDSEFVAAMNSGQETFPENDVTTIYTRFDLLVQPTESAALAPAPGADNVENVLIQDLCPGRPVDHAFLFIDHVMYQLAADAFSRPGPADPSVVEVADCAQASFQGTDPLLGLQIGLDSFVEQRGFDYQPTDGEPPLKDYAHPAD